MAWYNNVYHTSGSTWSKAASSTRPATSAVLRQRHPAAR